MKYNHLLGFLASLLLTGIIASCVPTQASSSLILYPLDDRLDAQQFQSAPGAPLAILSLDGEEWVLSLSQRETTQDFRAMGIEAETIGRIQPDQGELYLVEFYPWDAALVELPDLNAYGEQIWQQGPYILLQTSPEQAAALSEMGLRLYPLDEPVQVMARPITLPAPPTTADPSIERLLRQLTATEIRQWNQRLSGEVSIEIGAQPLWLRSRYSHSANGRRSEQFVFEQLEAMGYTPRYHQYKTPYGKVWRNVVVDIPGQKHPDEMVLLIGHLDSISFPTKYAGKTAPGADDNGSGSAALLAMADLLKGTSFDKTLRFVWFTGEEMGYWGSRPYVRALAKQDAHVIAAINVDMVGYDGDQDRVVEVHTGKREINIQLGDHLAAANALYDLGLVIERKQTSAARFSDHQSFWNYGYPSVLVIENFFNDGDEDIHGRDRNPAYHQTTDQANLLDFDYITAIARMALASAVHLAGPLTSPISTPTSIPTPSPTSTQTTLPTPTSTPTPIPTLTLPPTPTPTPTTDIVCEERLVNGGFEESQGWRRLRSRYTARIAHSGKRSLRVGLVPRNLQLNAEANKDAEVAAVRRVRPGRISRATQTIQLPKDAISITLHFWYWPGSDARKEDWQRVRLLRPGWRRPLATLMKVRENDRAWKQAQFDLTRYAGRKITLAFEVYNNRTWQKGRTWMFVDDVSLQVCRPLSPSRTTPTPTP